MFVSILRTKTSRLILTIAIIAATLGVFAWYIATHPKVVDVLLHLHPTALLLLTLAYSLTILANAYILHVSLAYVSRSTPFIDIILLTGYSSIVNFFGPLQSGPGFRAAYLKKKYKVEIRRFLAATLIFYLFFGIVNLLVLVLAGVFEYPNLRLYIGGVFVLGGIFIVPFFTLAKKTKPGATFFANARLRDPHFWLIGAGAIGLSLATASAYYIELLQVRADVTFWQTIIYTAAANLALFVSITPGAIGFRESFLVLSEKLHHISTDAIVAASILDRAFYVGFLLVMFGTLLLLNFRRHLGFFARR